MTIEGENAVEEPEPENRTEWKMCIDLGDGPPWRHYVTKWPEIVVTHGDPGEAFAVLAERILAEAADITPQDRADLLMIRGSSLDWIARSEHEGQDDDEE